MTVMTGAATTTAHRSALQIGRTSAGPRPLPSPGVQRTVADLELVDRTLPSGLRVIAVVRYRADGRARFRVPFAGAEPTRAARAELVASALLTGTVRRSRVEIDDELAAIGGELRLGRPERLC